MVAFHYLIIKKRDLDHKPGEWEELAAPWCWLDDGGPAARLVTLDMDTLVLRLCEREEGGAAAAAGFKLPPVVLFLIPNIPVLSTRSEDFRFGVEMKRSLVLSVPVKS